MNKDEAEIMASQRNIDVKSIFNINSPQQVIEAMRGVGLPVPKDRFTGKETTGEEKLNTLLAETGHPLLRAILRTRELSKILGTYVNCELVNNVLYCSYAVTGTVGGRRSSRVNVFGYGTNHQNQPKHSELGKRFRECLIARPGRIFLKCDQAGAEDWLVQGIITDISGDRRGLDELQAGVDRHRKLASFIFSKPESECGKDQYGHDTPERFIGKKTRHAGNYEMGASRMSEMLAKENKIVPINMCEYWIDRFHKAEPSIRGVFHKYIQDELIATRRLTTPFGRQRDFFALRPFTDNKKIFKEAYSYIPQSTVGDNTGMAEVYIEKVYPYRLIMDEHDAVLLEVDDDVDEICTAAKVLVEAFNRPIVFPRGTTFTIPIEIDMGYNLQHTETILKTHKCRDISRTGLEAIWTGLKEAQRVRNNTTGGLVPPSSEQALNAMSG